MSKKYFLSTILIFVCSCILAACGPSKNPAVTAAENYINALVNKDINRMSALSCETWEDSARLEYDSFQAIATRLDGLSCSVTSTNGNETIVTCKGKIIATYNNEDEEFDLSQQPFTVVNQGGDFLVCKHE